ncbi:MAG: hypothetical protein ABSE45_01690 [Candidatus Acidiferrales bacterium]
MPLRVLFDGDWDLRIKREIEEAIRGCVGEPPADQDWAVSVFLSTSFQYCEVRVKTPHQTRRRIFFEDPRTLPKAIPDWIGLYPLR